MANTAPGALRHIFTGHFQMHATRMGAHLRMDVEERAKLVADAFERTSFESYVEQSKKN